MRTSNNDQRRRTSRYSSKTRRITYWIACVTQSTILTTAEGNNVGAASYHREADERLA